MTNVRKSNEGWNRFRARTDNGKRKRPANAFKSYRPRSKSRPVR